MCGHKMNNNNNKKQFSLDTLSVGSIIFSGLSLFLPSLPLSPFPSFFSMSHGTGVCTFGFPTHHSTCLHSSPLSHFPYPYLLFPGVCATSQCLYGSHCISGPVAFVYHFLFFTYSIKVGVLLAFFGSLSLVSHPDPRTS